MTGLAETEVHLASGIEAQLLGGRQRRDRRGDAWLAGPFDTREHRGRARPELAARRHQRAERGGLARESQGLTTAAAAATRATAARPTAAGGATSWCSGPA